jgi:osmoprotectant transport system permease protein
VQVVATATLAALIAGGGFGRYIVDGLDQQDYAKLVAGAILVAGLALATELVLAGVQRLLVPRGIRLLRIPASSRAAVYKAA